MPFRSRAFAAGLILGLLVSAVATENASAQYFGRNKVQYDQFDFLTLPTDNFDIYFYPEQEAKIQDVASMSVRWFRRHSRKIQSSFTDQKTLILSVLDVSYQLTQ